eukprot:388978_1
MAYWLGFLFADGCVYGVGSTARINLNLKCTDYSHVEKFKEALQSSYRLALYTTNSSNCRATHSIYNSLLTMDLIQLGCTPQKSLTLEWPKNIPEEYVHHFVRGYFDGDGCIHFRKTENCLAVLFCGTHEFMAYLQSYIKTNVLFDSIAKGYIGDGHNVTHLRYAGVSSPLAILNWMYKDSGNSTRLERKYALYKKFSEISDLKPSPRGKEMINYIASDKYQILLQCQHQYCCPQLICGPKKRNNQLRKVVQIDKRDGSIIKVWENALTVSKELEYQNSIILKACKAEIKTAYGYVWKFEDII